MCVRVQPGWRVVAKWEGRRIRSAGPVSKLRALKDRSRASGLERCWSQAGGIRQHTLTTHTRALELIRLGTCAQRFRGSRERGGAGAVQALCRPIPGLNICGSCSSIFRPPGPIRTRAAPCLTDSVKPSRHAGSCAVRRRCHPVDAAP